MGLDLWFREDVARILAGLAQQAARRNDGDYGEGYLDALSDVALSFGLTVQNEAQRVSREQFEFVRAGR
jgi:hypothetical protein